jgi:hypothetical protein
VRDGRPSKFGELDVSSMSARQPGQVFISYSRQDQEDFARRLYADLTSAGISVWWDREGMESRGRTFMQEIFDAIAGCERLLLLVSPASSNSEYVRAEWEFALQRSTVIIPLLRSENRELVPRELSKLHSPDFRDTRPYGEALVELLRILQTCAGQLHDVEEAPAHFLPRLGELDSLSEHVLQDLDSSGNQNARHSRAVRKVVAVHGMGGVGKSVLLARFAEHYRTRFAFPDGIFWVDMRSDLAPERRLKKIADAFGDVDARDYMEPERAITELHDRLKNRECLIILDDLKTEHGARLFLRTLGPRCRLVVSTRDASIATALGASEYELGVLSRDAALRLLASWSGQSEEELPEEARLVADACGGLPFALALCGGNVVEGLAWHDLLHALKSSPLDAIKAPYTISDTTRYSHTNIASCLQISLDALDRSDPKAGQLYRRLAVFPYGQQIPQSAIGTLWRQDGALGELDLPRLLGMLQRKALIRLTGPLAKRLVSLHPLLYEFLRPGTQSAQKSLHEHLLEAYRAELRGPWATGPDDGYFFDRLAYHLEGAGRHQELGALLLNFDWLRAKLNATHVFAVLSDFDIALRTALEVQELQRLKVVDRAIRLAAHILLSDKSQLWGQLRARLAGLSEIPLDFLPPLPPQQPYFLPVSRSLISPADPVLSLIQTSEHVTSNLITWLGLIIAGDITGAVRVWDWKTGSEVLTIRAHKDPVRAVALSADGSYVASGSGDDLYLSLDTGIKLWDRNTGVLVRTLTQHTERVSGVL